MQNNIKIRARIFLVSIIPIIGLLYFSGQIVYQARLAVLEIDRVRELAELAPRISALVHELQKERGASAGFTGSNGKTFGKILARQRKVTETETASLRASLKTFDRASYGAALERKIRNSLAALDGLPGIRAEISRLKPTTLQVTRQYSTIIEKFLVIVEEMAVLGGDARVAGAINAYTSFLQGKERAGIERAIGASGFAAGRFEPALYRNFVELISAQDTYFRVFAIHATAEQKMFLKSTLVGALIDAVNRMREVALNNPRTGNLAGIEGPYWYRTVTEKINLLKKVEDKIADDLVKTASDIRSSALATFQSSLIATLVLLVITILLVLTIARGITKPLAKITGAMSELAGGDKTIRVSGTARTDEIGEMARSVEVFKEAMIRADNLVTEQTMARKELEDNKALLELLHKAAVSANQASDVDTAMQACLDDICGFTGWPVGHVFFLSNTPTDRLVSTDIWHIDDPDRFAMLRQVTENTEFEKGNGLPGRVLATGKPVLIRNVQEDQNFPRAEMVADIGVKGAFAVPVLVGNEVNAVLEFFTDEIAPPEEMLLGVEVLIHIGTQIGRSVERRQKETELRLSEEALRRSQKLEAIGQLAGGIAHDFNNLLGGNLEIMKRIAKGDEKILGRVETALKGARRGADLTKSLLGISRQDAGSTKAVSLNDLITEMREIIAKSLTGKIEVQTYLAGDLDLTEIDAGDFEDTILNLSINARDAMPLGGNLIIETSNALLDEGYVKLNPDATPGNYVMLAISDTGTGMSAETLDQVFEPFYTTKEKGKGTGLGLSMVYGFVRRSGGHIKIYSEIGNGTTIRLYLPRSAAAVAATGRAGAPGDEPLPGGDETVLVVDDETYLIDIAVHHLEDLGYRTLSADSAKRALEILEGEAGIDLLFSDVVMPGGMDGFDLAKEALGRYPDLRVLLTSGFTARLEETQTGDAQTKALAAALLGKPYERGELARRVRKVLDGAVGINA